jgi:hypothetical protein
MKYAIESAIATWGRGFKIIIFFVLVIGIALATGGLVTSMLFAILIVLPVEASSHNNDIEPYFLGAAFLGMFVFGPYFVGQGRKVMKNMLDDIG